MYVCPAYSPSTQHTSNAPKAPSGRKVKLVELKKIPTCSNCRRIFWSGNSAHSIQVKYFRFLKPVVFDIWLNVIKWFSRISSAVRLNHPLKVLSLDFHWFNSSQATVTNIPGTFPNSLSSGLLKRIYIVEESLGTVQLDTCWWLIKMTLLLIQRVL